MSKPFGFRNIVGHAVILDRLRLDIEHKRCAHAYIFAGEYGSGRDCVAQAFANAIHCGNGEPCGECAQCVKSACDSHPDTVFFDKGIAASFSVDLVREVIEELFAKPLISDKKVLILKDCDDMTDGAQNALLKALEEPPAYAVLILIATNVKNLRATVISRAVTVNFLPHPNEVVKEFLANNYPEKKASIDFITAYSCGLLGRGVRLIEDEGFVALRKDFYDAFCGFASSKRSVIYELLDVMKDDGMDYCIQLLLMWLRDCAVVKVQAGLDIVNTDYKDAIIRFAGSVCLEGILKFYSSLGEYVRGYGKGRNRSLWLTGLLLEGWDVLHGDNSRSAF